MTSKVFSFFVFTILAWTIFFIVSCIVFCGVFDMHPRNPEYATLAHIWRMIGYFAVFPSAVVGMYAVRKGWWE